MKTLKELNKIKIMIISELIIYISVSLLIIILNANIFVICLMIISSITMFQSFIYANKWYNHNIHLIVAERLIKKYRSITIEDIEKHFDVYNMYFSHIIPLNGPPYFIKWLQDNAMYIARKLTGFGSSNTCSLCKANSINGKCILAENLSCSLDCKHGENRIYYQSIKNSRTPEELVIAFQNAANRLEEILKTIYKRY